MLLKELIDKFQPMLANTGKPFNSVDYIYEIKWDGIRSIMIIFFDVVYIISRNGNILNNRYPELTQEKLSYDDYPVILDGEIVYLQNGKPNFQRLMARDKLRNPELIKKQIISTPVVYMAFDILKVGNQDLISLPLSKRKEILENTIEKIDNQRIKLSEYISENGIDFYNAAKELGLEGVMAKKKGSKYIPGKRTTLWQKIKCINSDEFIICGYLPGLRLGLGSLILGQFNAAGEILYRGQVGTGFTNKEALLIKEYLDKIRVNYLVIKDLKFKERAYWVEPMVVATVEYLEITQAGILRHPSFKSIREDKEISDCVTKEQNP